MTWKPMGDGLAFSPDQMPLYHGHVPPGESVRRLEADCCPRPVCKQRDYNRAVLLTLEKFSQAYAALLLARHAASVLWRCDADGHTADCKDPACTFGQQIDLQYATNQKDFGVYLRSFCAILARCATDLTPQWQDFTDTEQFYIGLMNSTGEEYPVEYLAALREAAVLCDPVEFARWFRPPGDAAS